MSKKNLNSETRLKKNETIKASLKATRAKRELQDCCVVLFKISESKTPVTTMKAGKRLFAEKRWMTNYVIGRSNDDTSFDVFKFEFGTTVVHKDKDFNDVTEPIMMGSQIKQSVVSDIRQSIRSMSALKKAGHKIGKLKFVTECNSIELKQHKITYQITRHPKNKSKGKLKIQGIKLPFVIYGLQQLDEIGLPYEMANAKFLRRSDGYFVAVTLYVDKAENQKRKMSNVKTDIYAFDAGCSESYTRSDGKKCKCDVREPDQLKKLQQKLENQVKGSKRRDKTKLAIKRQYQKLNNKKTDAANKIFHQMMEAETVVVQDEQIAGWQENGHGKAVTHSCLGRVKRKLETESKSSGRVIILNKWVPTTKLCTKCGKRHEMSLYDREFNCDCGVHAERDAHAAQNMVWFYKHNIGIGKDNNLTQDELNKLIAEAIASDNQLVDCQEDINSGKSGTDSTINNARPG